MSKKIIPDYLNLDPKFLGLTALNSYSHFNSSPRGYMFLSQLAQSLTLMSGDLKLWQNGIEKELGKATFNKVLPAGSMVLGIVKKYHSLTNDTINANVESTVFYLDTVKNELNIVNVPMFDKYDIHFGFEYKHKVNLDNLYNNEVIEEEIILAESVSIKDDSYAYGVNLNMCLLSTPETDEDAVQINEEALDKLKFKLWETRHIILRENEIPLNLYGDDEIYKVLPDIGENIHESNILFSKRNINSNLSPFLLNTDTLKEADVNFDNNVYVRGSSGKVVDIEVISNKINTTKITYSKTLEQIDKYARSLNKYYQEMIDMYNYIRRQYNSAFIGNKLHRTIVNMQAILNPNLINTWKKEDMGLYYITVTIEYEIKPTKGFKITDSAGAKGINCVITKKEDMPVDKHGNVADVVMDPISLSKRMNVGRVYEQYMNAVSRKIKKDITEEVYKLDNNLNVYNIKDNYIINLYNYIIGLLKIINNEQYVIYKQNNDINIMREVLQEIVDKEFYGYLPIDNKKPIDQIVLEIKNSVYAPDIGPVTYKFNGEEITTKENVLIAPVYTILLNKIADDFISTASSNLNHFGVPVRMNKNKKYTVPWSDNPVKLLSETETRLVASYVGIEGIAELKARANDHETHVRIYKNILNADNPMGVYDLAERDKYGYNDDEILRINKTIMRSGGLGYEYIPEELEVTDDNN